MPSSTIQIPHNLGRDEAVSRLKNMLEQMKVNHGNQVSDLQEDWRDDGGTFSFKAMGFKIAGELDVTDTEAIIHADFPFAAKPFQKTIENTIRERGAKLLA